VLSINLFFAKKNTWLLCSYLILWMIESCVLIPEKSLTYIYRKFGWSICFVYVTSWTILYKILFYL